MTGETFGQMLRRLRERQAGLSQNELARLAGVDPAYVNRLERGGLRTVSGQAIPVIQPSRPVALRFASALGLSDAMTDRFLFAAGLAPQVDWQTRAQRAETALATIRAAFEDAVSDDGRPIDFVRRTG